LAEGRLAPKETLIKLRPEAIFGQEPTLRIYSSLSMGAAVMLAFGFNSSYFSSEFGD